MTLIIYGGRHLISMEEGTFSQVITIGDVIDSIHMPINKGNAHGTQRERNNGVNFQHSILLSNNISVSNE